MKRRPEIIITVIILVVLVAVIYITFPGLSGRDPHLQANRLFDQGITCENKEDYVCAEDKFGQAVQMYAKDNRFFFHLAQVQTKLGKYSLAMNNYQQAKSLDPSDPNVMAGFERAMSMQATQTATFSVTPPSSTPPGGLISSPTPEIQIVQSIFDEEIGMAGITTMAQTVEDKIGYSISADESYTGTKSLLVNWTKTREHWASLVLGFDSAIADTQKAQAGQMSVFNLAPPADYAIQFFVKGITGGERFTLKFQDQNLFFKESLGNQAVYIYKKIPDGVLSINGTDWQAFCLPLADFDTDYWIKEKYATFTAKDLQFNWSKVKQINIDAGFQSTEGAIYVDDMRIIRSSDCPLLVE